MELTIHKLQVNYKKKKYSILNQRKINAWGLGGGKKNKEHKSQKQRNENQIARDVAFVLG